ncbi:MAG TPA: hypothetical protein DDY58_18190 [Terrisporobacter glycolicus]|uniref:hypothetical protein n=1 Tax=Terrisporobacter TaxID=1505652 RepID=UPI000E89825F|nr:MULTISPECIES: hypothetical protein [Terrisporobacter]MBN9646150.1 hypothetical protein [Terrisporobacter glycolicus]HBI94187.1 hypothetical protein [Terrisporobacter hibernicus]
MNKELFNRLCEAKKYQSMAIKSLFPENMADHIDIIEKEIKIMMVECISDLISLDIFESKDNKVENKSIKKVNID